MDPAGAGLDIARLVTKRRIQDGRRFTCPDIASLSFRGYYRTAVSRKCDSRDGTQVESFQEISFQALRPRLEIFVTMEFGDSFPGDNVALAFLDFSCQFRLGNTSFDG